MRAKVRSSKRPRVRVLKVKAKVLRLKEKMLRKRKVTLKVKTKMPIQMMKKIGKHRFSDNAFNANS